MAAEEMAVRGLQPCQGASISAEPQQGGPWEVYVVLTNGRVFGCDLIVSATGAYPNTSCLSNQTGKMEVSILPTELGSEITICTVSAE